MNYYDRQHRKHTADLRPWGYAVAILAIVIVLTIVHSCALGERNDLLPELTPAQRAEVISRLSTPFDREHNIDLADRILDARVEADWREGR